MGGAQMFAMRIAAALSKYDRVIVTSVELLPPDPQFTRRLEAETTFVDTHGEIAALAKVIERERIDAISSHGWWSDRHVHAAISRLPASVARPRWVISMHGCYEQLLVRPEVDPTFASLAPAVLRSADAIAIAAVKNRRVFEAMSLDDTKVAEVPYGFQASAPRTIRRVAGDVVFGLVSRPAADKGWLVSIEAFRIVRDRLALRGRSAALVLVGGGPYADALKDAHRNEPGLTFAGWSDRPEEWIAGFDVALLPTWFVSESLPNSIIEYLAQSVPIIASRWAEIPRMIGEGADAAGVLIGVDGEQGVALPELADAMERMANDGVLRGRCALMGPRHASRFDMERCVASYRAMLRLSSNG